ncbi:hypothetical protein V2S66_16525 [Streptomyces sp. V4-01]|uniref:Uncharacterized protein n=1 Tax=Actinacidiphila polyblastidii TaxID=3110430 RepID=A0ABU7PCN4_9ACTN|nr:hypothetical protein [Streptomyces sp. V4-01]
MRAAATFLLAAGLAVPALAAAPAAQAADATVTGVTTDDNGKLNVSLTTSDALWVQVSVRASAAADAPVLATTDALTQSGGGWKTEQTVSLPAGTAYGDYPVDVDYRLFNGTVQHWAGADHRTVSDLNYRLHTGVSNLAFDRTTLDYDHQSTVLSGTATTLDPATGQSGAAAAGTKVELDYDAVGGLRSYKTTATVADGGTFQAPLTLPLGIENVRAVAVPDATTTARPLVWDFTPPRVITTRYRLSAEESRTRTNPNVAYTEKGSVERYAEGYWQPWTGVTVSTASSAGDPSTGVLSGVLGHGATDANGAFSYAVTPTRTTDTFTVLQPTPYLTGSSAAYEHIAVPTPGSFTTPAGSIDQYATVTLAGSLKGSCDYQPLSLEYSANGTTGWTTMQWFQANGGNYNGTCSYSVTKDAYYNGYYRVRHPETDVMQPAVTVVKHIYRYRTGMSIAMSSTKPKTNAKLTASGNVYQLTTAGWKPYAGVHVVLVFKPRYDPNWYWVVKGYTNAYGHYALNTTAFGDGTWAAYIEPNSSHYYSESKQVYVDAH